MFYCWIAQFSESFVSAALPSFHALSQDPFDPRSIVRVPVSSLTSVKLLSHVHAVRLRILQDANCRSYGEKCEVETSQHFLLHYPAFEKSRLKHLKAHTFRYPTELVVIELANLYWPQEALPIYKVG